MAVGLCSSLITLQASLIASVLLYFFFFFWQGWGGVGVALCGLWDLSSLTWN